MSVHLPDESRSNPDLMNLSSENEFQDWSKGMGVNRMDFRKAVKAVGNNVKRIEKYLKKNSRYTETVN